MKKEFILTSPEGYTYTWDKELGIVGLTAANNEGVGQVLSKCTNELIEFLVDRVTTLENEKWSEKK